MSKETLKWLNTNTLIGHTEKRGNAWHYRAEEQDGESNHFTGPVPVEAVERRLFSWEAVESPLFTATTALIEEATMMGPNGEPLAMREIPGRKAITRSDTGAVLGVFKEGYKPHQPREWLINNVELLVGGDLDIGSAGLLRGGAVAWLQVEESDNMVTTSGVEYRPFITAATSFDGTLATVYKVGVTVVVCDNTMAAALRADSPEIRIKHTRHSALDLSAMRDVLGIVEQAGETFANDVERLTNWTVTDAEWDAFLKSLCPVDVNAKSSRGETMAIKKRDDLTNLYFHDDRVTKWTGTAFGVLQAVNTWDHHLKTARGTQRAERNMMNALDGTTAESDSKTLATLSRVCVNA